MAPYQPPEDYSPGESSLSIQAFAERLHDGPLQDLVALQLEIKALLRAAAAAEPEARKRIAELAALIDRAVEHLRAVMNDLARAALPPARLLAQLIDLCDEFRSGTGIQCVLHVDPKHTQFVPEVSDVLHRTVRELLTNVRKHARASVVKLSSLSRPDGTVALCVEDDGVGLPPITRRKKPFAGGGFGLWSIDHRLSTFDAYLELDGATGVRATIVVPARWLAAD